MDSVGLVASQNGLGHARRLVHFAAGFTALGYKVFLFLSPVQHEKLRLEISKICPQISIVQIESYGLDGPSTENLIIKEIPKSHLLLLQKLDYVISDNVTWPGRFLDSFVLMGHFTWIDYWRQNPRGIYFPITQSETEAVHISKWFRPFCFTHQYTSLMNIEKIEIPLARYVTDSMTSNETDPSKIIFSNGTTGLNLPHENELRIKINRIGLNLEFKESYNVDKTLLPALIIGRPGLGTIRDCLAFGIPFLPYWTGKDPELSNNETVLKSCGLIPLDWDGNRGLDVEIVQDFIKDKEKQDRIRRYWTKNSAPVTELIQLMGF